ncbi:MAG: sulfatase-like hydrolase/transferase [Deltaproteobacteria bacterium]|jgi:uncharacterized protein|nr:sulfatase-like hydrolase/transferase [Deltaproteobacteria bacterium]
MIFRFFKSPKSENGYSVFLMAIYTGFILFLQSLTFINSDIFENSVLINVFLIITAFFNPLYLTLVFFPVLYLIYKILPKLIFRLFFSLLTGILFTYVFIDKIAFNQFKFHINSFIIKIFTQPRALQVLGIGFKEILVIVLIIMLASSVTYIIYSWVIQSKIQVLFETTFRSYFKKILLLFLILTIATLDKFTFAWLLYNKNISVHTLAKRLPFYMTSQGGRFFNKMGFKQRTPKNYQPLLKLAKKNIHYPLSPFTPSIKDSKQQLPNIILLMSDALRQDVYSEQLMPNSYKALNQRSLNFVNHFSGSNGTTQALFSILYGLPPNYMTFFSKAKVSPVIFEALFSYQYQINILSSKSLGWMGTDQVVFSTVKQYIEDELDYSSIKSDKMVTKRAIDILENHQNNPDKPLFLMVFYDSTHLPHFTHPAFNKYQPSKTGIIFDPQKKEDRERGYNEYRNAVDYVDSLLGNIYQQLEKHHYFDNSIIMLTSDHGSEKYEHGHWGHASAFTNEQLKVPFVLAHPGSQKQTITTLTSHLDISATLIDLIGDSYKTEHHTAGQSLVNRQPRDFIMAGGAANRVLIDNHYKIDYTPFELISYYKVTGYNDEPVDNPDLIITEYTPKILKMFTIFQKFLK